MYMNSICNSQGWQSSCMILAHGWNLTKPSLVTLSDLVMHACLCPDVCKFYFVLLCQIKVFVM